jgi:hypothetical protein
MERFVGVYSKVSAYKSDPCHPFVPESYSGFATVSVWFVSVSSRPLWTGDRVISASCICRCNNTVVNTVLQRFNRYDDVQHGVVFTEYCVFSQKKNAVKYTTSRNGRERPKRRSGTSIRTMLNQGWRIIQMYHIRNNMPGGDGVGTLLVGVYQGKYKVRPTQTGHVTHRANE